MRQYALLFALVLAFGTANAQSQLSTQNYTAQQANATLANAAYTLQSINESGYLIFQPNLTQAYKYLSLGYLSYNTSPSAAVFYAQEAVQSAQQQYSDISYYKSVSLIVIAAYSILVLFALIKVMDPIKRTKGKAGGKKGGRKYGG